MPYPTWRIGPCCPREITYSPEAQCPRCRRRRAFRGWRLTMYEAMARYQYVYGLKPIGPHRPLADRLLTPLRLACPRCDAIGVTRHDDGSGWRLCPDCEGTGGAWIGAEEDLQAAYAQILAAFPESAAPEAPPAFLTGPLAYDEATGLMIEIRLKRGVPVAAARQGAVVAAPAPSPLPKAPAATLPVQPAVASTPPNDHEWVRWSWLAIVVVRILMVALGQ
jgi:hypothetical protein